MPFVLTNNYYLLENRCIHVRKSFWLDFRFP